MQSLPNMEGLKIIAPELASERQKKKEEKKLRKPGEKKQCSYCGADLNEGEKRCPNCNKILSLETE